MKKRVAIIGAGPSGLSLLRAFQAAEEKGAEIPDLVCFEKQGDVGGLWNFSEGSGVDEHASMYRDLYINGPKELNEYVDYSFEEHFGKPIGSYPPRPVLLAYIKGRADKFRLGERFVRCHSKVKTVTYSDETAKFSVTVVDFSSAAASGELKEYSEEFDHVVVATGHFSTPNVPQFEGLNGFGGSLLHAHDLRDVSPFKGKDVLLIGSSYSAEDIACQCYKFGAKSVTISYRSRPTGCRNWPESIKEVPLLERVDPNGDGKTCHFKDGSRKDFDAIILCTGYLHDFPFMPESLRLVTENRMWPLGLYEGVVLESDPIVFYLGMQAQFYSFIMFDAQAWYVRDVIMGRLKLPSIDEMRAHSENWKLAEEEALAKTDVKSFQADYVNELISQTDCPIKAEVMEKTLQMGGDWDKHKAQGIMSYRDHAFLSAVTGNLARDHITPWLHAFDDSLESYVK